jgi:hypothetical protein
MFTHEPSQLAAGIPLKTHVEELRRRCEAIARLQGGSTYYTEEFGIFRDYANEAGLVIPTQPDELNRIPDEEGNEHQVWFEENTRTYLKATWHDFFGLLVVHRPLEEPKASPISYLERWDLHNEVFGDQIAFLGALQTDRGLRLLIRQPAIAGTPATDEQIRRFFTESGWLPFVIEDNLAFFDPERGIVISDTHRGNIILMQDGLLAPIDLRVQRLTGALLETVSRLCQSSQPQPPPVQISNPLP